VKSLGFSKSERLKSYEENQTVFKKGKKYSCIGAKLFVLENGMERNRIAFTFPRGYGSAVERNYSRRLSREVFRLNKQQISKGYDFVLLIFPGKDSFSDRLNQIHTLFSRAGLWLIKK